MRPYIVASAYTDTRGGGTTGVVEWYSLWVGGGLASGHNCACRWPHELSDDPTS